MRSTRTCTSAATPTATRSTPAGLLADLERWGLESAVCFPANEPGPDRQFAGANAGDPRRRRGARPGA